MHKKNTFLDFAQLSPVIRHVNDVKATPANYIPSRVIFDHEFIFIRTGVGQVQIGQHVYDLNKNNLILLRPGITNWWKADHLDPYQILCIHFDFYPQLRSKHLNNFSSPIFGIEGTEFPTLITINDGDKYVRNHYQLLQEFSGNKPFRHLTMQSIFMQMLVQIYRELTTDLRGGNRGAKKKQIMPVLRYIEENFPSPIESKDLAAIAGFHPTYFCRVFQEVIGQSPLEYLTNIRLKHAKQLLLYSNKSIQDIAAEVGYSSLHYFSRLFKKQEGISPKGFVHLYTKNIQSKNELSKITGL